ncbi:hypothetical protein HDU93_001314 [Gonapodya sp. JEL0774]|nr:hypothetical protein HDU93_001314 [Gonapodya sp. JEL0774]
MAGSAVTSPKFDAPHVRAIHNHQLYVAEQNAIRMMKLVHEFPQLRTIAADAVKKSSTVRRIDNRGGGSPLPIPTAVAQLKEPHTNGMIPQDLDSEGKPLITEGQLRSFLFREHQQTRPDGKRNPAMTTSVPVVARARLSDNLGWVPGGRNARDKEGIKVRLAHAKEDAEAYRQPTEQLWQEYWTVRPSSATGWQGIVEERIEQAKRAGLFDDIKGRGRPIQESSDSNNPFLDRTEYFLNKAIKSQGNRPYFIEMSKDIDEEIRLFRKEMRLIYESATTPPAPPRPATSTSHWLSFSSSVTSNQSRNRASSTPPHSPTTAGTLPASYTRRATSHAAGKVKEINE